MMAYETDHDLVVVDCGILFPSAEQPGIDYIIPDVTYLRERKDKLRAIVLTHGHEDHLGALPFVLEELQAPVYGTRFTLALLESKLGERRELKPVLTLMRDFETFTIGSFEITPIPVTHSIPDAVALVLRTATGVVVHTGDFKIDPHPRDGRVTAGEYLEALGKNGVMALFSDSTNAEKPGHTWTEDDVGETLEELITSAPRRVIITTFASHIHRIQRIIEASEHAGRKVVPVGRSMQQNLQLSLERGFLTARYGTVADADELHRLPTHKVTVLASGSQGEPESALARIAASLHQTVSVTPGDRVIFSSRRIPGKERDIGDMVNRLVRLGAEVVDDHSARVHASGHAFNDEQAQMINWCQPRFFVPIHGEYRHLARHGALARAQGLAPQRVAVLEDGQPVEFIRTGNDVQMRRAAPVTAGHVYVDGLGVGDIGDVVLHDRRVLAETGVVLCVLLLRTDGTVVGGPDLITRGVVHVEANQELLERATEEVRAVVANGKALGTGPEVSDRIRQVLRRFFRRELDRRPLVLPVVMSL